MGMNVPVVLMVGYRGWTRHGVNTDTAATYTERFLMAFDINYYLVESDADADAHLHRIRGGGTNAATRRGAGGRRIPRVQPMSAPVIASARSSRQLREWSAMMHTAEVLKVFAEHRGDAIVVPGRGGRHWVKLTTHETLDVPLGDPAMGGHAGFALGLALAQPDRRVVLFDSEGDILMSLGMLATIAEQAPAEFLSLPAGQRMLRDDRRPAGAERQDTSPMMCWRAAPAIRARSPSPSCRNSPGHCPGSSPQPARCSSR